MLFMAVLGFTWLLWAILGSSGPHWAGVMGANKYIHNEKKDLNTFELVVA